MIYCIACDSLNTEPLSVKRNKSVFERVLFAQNNILIICLEALRSALLQPPLSADSCTKCKTSSLLQFLLLRVRVSIKTTMRVSKSLPSMIWETSAKLGILSQLCSTTFTITIMNEICWSLKSCEANGCYKPILMKMIRKC